MLASSAIEPHTVCVAPKPFAVIMMKKSGPAEPPAHATPLRGSHLGERRTKRPSHPGRRRHAGHKRQWATVRARVRDKGRAGRFSGRADFCVDGPYHM